MTAKKYTRRASQGMESFLVESLAWYLEQAEHSDNARAAIDAQRAAIKTKVDLEQIREMRKITEVPEDAVEYLDRMLLQVRKLVAATVVNAAGASAALLLKLEITLLDRRLQIAGDSEGLDDEELKQQLNEMLTKLPDTARLYLVSALRAA